MELLVILVEVMLNNVPIQILLPSVMKDITYQEEFVTDVEQMLLNVCHSNKLLFVKLDSILDQTDNVQLVEPTLLLVPLLLH